MAHMINKELEPFSVMGYRCGDSRPYTQEDLLGHWSVLFFYPADFTFVCPTELKDLSEQYEGFQAEDCEIYSVSEDTHFVHKAWADASDTIKAIPFPMLADPAGRGRPCGPPSCSTPRGGLCSMRFTTWASVAAHRSCCASSRRPALWRSTVTKCALPTGTPVRRP